MIKVNGYPSPEQIKSKFPDESQLVKAKAIIECYQEIPCNPCAASCPFDAITIGPDINQMPTLNVDLCTGCGTCVYACPGLAIMIAKIKDDKAYFKIPYEMLPVPKPKEIWQGVNRRGEVICDALIEGVMVNPKTDRTVIVTVSVPKKYLYEFITVRCPK